MKKTLVAISVAGLTSFSFGASFDGPFVQLGIGGVGTQNKTTYQGETADILNFVGISSNQTTNGGSFVGKVDAGWSQSIDKFNLAGGIFYVIGDQNAGSNSFSQTYTSGSDFLNVNGSQSYKLKNSWGLTVEPGYYITEQTLGYLKFSWFNSRVSTSPSLGASYSIGGNTGSASSTTSTSNTVNGAGFGIGAKQMFTDNVYGYLEYQYVQYGSTTDNTVGASYKQNQNYGMVGLGYKF